MGVNGVQWGLLWVLWASCQQGSLILHQLNRLPTDRSSLFWQHSPKFQTNPVKQRAVACEDEGLVKLSIGTDEIDFADWINVLVLCV